MEFHFFRLHVVRPPWENWSQATYHPGSAWAGGSFSGVQFSLIRSIEPISYDKMTASHINMPPCNVICSMYLQVNCIETGTIFD